MSLSRPGFSLWFVGFCFFFLIFLLKIARDWVWFPFSRVRTGCVQALQLPLLPVLEMPPCPPSPLHPRSSPSAYF